MVTNVRFVDVCNLLSGMCQKNRKSETIGSNFALNFQILHFSDVP
jgi:hypothetical protein